MRTIAVLLSFLLVTACASGPDLGYPPRVYLDDMSNVKRPVHLSFPKPLNADPRDGEYDLVLTVVNATGNKPVEFDVTLSWADETIEVWTAKVIEQGIAPMSELSESAMEAATRTFAIRLTSPACVIHVKPAVGRSISRNVKLANGERTLRMVLLTPLGPGFVGSEDMPRNR